MKRMREIAPSILSADFGNLARDVKMVEECGIRYLHIDVMDGSFVPNISLGAPVIKGIRRITTMIFDVHLMIVDPLKYIDDFSDAGADMISFHLEAVDNPIPVIDKIHSRSVKAGIVIKPNTDVRDLSKYLDKVDYVLVMSVEPGFGGQKFMPESLDKIKWLVEEKKAKGLDFIIEIDGGVCLDNIKEVSDAGAQLLVMGSAVYGREDVPKAIAEYKGIIE